MKVNLLIRYFVMIYRFAHKHIARLADIGGRGASSFIGEMHITAGNAQRIGAPVDQAFRLLAAPAILQACTILVANQRVVLVAAVCGNYVVAGAFLRQMYRTEFQFGQRAAVYICKNKK